MEGDTEKPENLSHNLLCYKGVPYERNETGSTGTK